MRNYEFGMRNAESLRIRLPCLKGVGKTVGFD